MTLTIICWNNTLIVGMMNVVLGIIAYFSRIKEKEYYGSVYIFDMFRLSSWLGKA